MTDQGAERMKKLLITLMLVSPFSFADWGDVYVCQMTTHTQISFEGKRTDYQLEVFGFMADKAKGAIVFDGPDGYFTDKTHDLVTFQGPDTDIKTLEGEPVESWITFSDLSTSLFTAIGDKSQIAHTALQAEAMVNINAYCNRYVSPSVEG